MKLPRKGDTGSKKSTLHGVHAVLGLDVVGFSRFSEEEQHEAVSNLFGWIRRALQYNDIHEDDLIWCHAGDGGYLTFDSYHACIRAINVAFDIVRRAKSGDWRRTSGECLTLRLGLHAGFVQQTVPLGLGMWKEASGAGINTAARILGLSAPGQILVSRQYYDAYMKNAPQPDIEIGPLHSRSVKHGVKVEVMNANANGLCLSQSDADCFQWQAISAFWQQMIFEYESLISDSLKAGSTLAAVAAAKFLLAFKQPKPVIDLCRAIGLEHDQTLFGFAVARHEILSQLSAASLLRVIELSDTRMVEQNEIICQRGDPAETCFFVVSGKVVVERPDIVESVIVRTGALLGEFGLWMSGLTRTATIRAITKSLIFEIPLGRFREVLNQSQGANLVFERIQERIMSNVFGAPDLFPGLDPQRVKGGKCVKLALGSSIDISETTYILFNGEVEVRLDKDLPKRITASGQARPDTVVGIISRLGKPDGTTAGVVSETVCVTVPHKELLRIFAESPAVQRVWDGLCGVRMAERQVPESGFEVRA
jgi:CRP-like cAMP-binding protein/class 3 adenylate cyclase